MQDDIPSLDPSVRNNFGHFSSVSKEFEKSQKFLIDIRKHKKRAINELLNKSSLEKLDQNIQVIKEQKPKNINIAT